MFGEAIEVFASALNANDRPADALRWLERAEAEGWRAVSLDLARSEALAMLGRDREAKTFLEKYTPSTPNEDIEEIRKILTHFEISLLMYHEDESERIDYDKDKFEKLVDEFSEKHSRVPDENEMKEIRAKCHNLAKSLPPNFIHSIDAFHMRKSINLLEDRVKSSNHPQLSFWSVHDAFGTHACDVAEMRKVVRQTFHDIHKDIDFNAVFGEDWIQPKKKDPKLVLSEILKAEYIIG